MNASERQAIQAEVIVVGCGPTGLVLALLLARQGHIVTMIERHPDLFPLPRAIAYDHEVARVLDATGVTEAMAPLVGLPGVYQWRNAARELLFELAWNGRGLSGYPHSYIFSQPQLEGVLNEAAMASPRIEIHRGLEARSFRQEESGVTLTAGPTGRPQEATDFRGRYLVGADGANSVIRASIGGALQDLGFMADWLVVDVLPLRSEAKLPVDDDVMLQVCDPARPTTVVSGGPGRRRWEFMALEGESADDLNRPERAWTMLAPWGVTPDNAVLERHAVYRFRGAVADKWRNGRVFIAGDAAHLTPPFAGQGLCAGVRDSAALAWRLDTALKGRATEAMLDSYGSERAEHAAVWVNVAIELGKVICVLDPKAAAARDKGLLAVRRDPSLAPPPPPLPNLGPGMVLEGKCCGQVAAGGRVSFGGRTGHFDNVVGRGFVLVSRGDDPARSLSPEMLAFWNDIGGVSAGFGPQGVSDDEGSYSAWLDDLGADTALVRPDFYVFGAGNGADAANDLVAALREFFAAPEQELVSAEGSAAAEL
jgi:2-polyprenyl-6-methoxyphenol hydroxylase-like FAD-dependent oxidoreductase